MECVFFFGRLGPPYSHVTLTQVVDQDPVLILLLLLLILWSAAATQLLHVAPEQSAGEPLEHPRTSCVGVRLRDRCESGLRRRVVSCPLVISCRARGCGGDRASETR